VQIFWRRLSLLKVAKKIKRLIADFKKERMGFRLSLLNVCLNEFSDIELDVLVSGIKNQIVKYSPEDIVFNDHLLSEFSSCDVRAITYLSFQRYIKFDTNSPILIQNQLIQQGRTIFRFLNSVSGETFTVKAIEAYQDYSFLNIISRKDMINVVSTAVQEQLLQDFKNMS